MNVKEMFRTLIMRFLWNLSQLTITSSQMQWTSDCTKALASTKERGDKKALKSLKKKQVRISFCYFEFLYCVFRASNCLFVFTFILLFFSLWLLRFLSLSRNAMQSRRICRFSNDISERSDVKVLSIKDNDNNYRPRRLQENTSDIYSSHS